MKAITIFKKNLKTVSRSGSYFVVLFVCPLLLVLIAGALLNSADFNNIKIGVVDKNPNYDLNLNEIKNLNNYDSIEACLYYLLKSEVSSCLYLSRDNEKNNVIIYLDNNHRLISMYTKQFILEKVFNEQSGALSETASLIDSKIKIYTNSIENAKIQLTEVNADLEDQEKTLVNYRENLTKARNAFNQIYFPLKAMQSSITDLKNNLTKDRENFIKNYSNFKTKKTEISNSINTIKSYLSSRLPASDYNYVASQLDTILTNLDSIDSSLNSINSFYSNQNLIQAINQLDLMIPQLDEIYYTLESIDNELGKAIDKTRMNKEKVNQFMNELNSASTEISSLSQNIDSGDLILSFKDAFKVPDNPVYIVFPLIVAIIITFSAVVLSNMFIIKQVNQPSYLRDLITPTKDIHFIIADCLINLFFMLIQIGVLFAIGHYWFGFGSAELVPFLAPVILATMVFIFMGVSLGYLIKSQSLSMLITIFIVMILLLFSDLLVPSMLAGRIIRFFVEMNPFVILDSALTQTLILKRSLESIVPQIAKLVLFGIVGFIITYFAKKVSKETATQ